MVTSKKTVSPSLGLTMDACTPPAGIARSGRSAVVSFTCNGCGCAKTRVPDVSVRLASRATAASTGTERLTNVLAPAESALSGDVVITGPFEVVSEATALLILTEDVLKARKETAAV